MDCLSAIRLLVIQIACINITAIFSSDQKQQLADALERLLKFPGWKCINARARYQNAANEIESFGGQDLYTFVLDLNVEYDITMENRIVHVENVDAKYDMMVHLLGCVYTKAVLTFFNLLEIISTECKKACRRCRNNAGKQITRNCVKLEIQLTGEERAFALKDSVDSVNFMTLFDFAMEQLENHNSMIARMSTALRYLIELAPSEKRQTELMLGLQRIRTHIDGIKRLAPYIRSSAIVWDTPMNNEEMYRKKLKTFSERVSSSVEMNKNNPLVKFKDSYCVLPVNEQIEQLKTEYRSDVVIEEFEKLENEVFTSFYERLGFVYDEMNQATILAPDNIDDDDDNNNA